MRGGEEDDTLSCIHHGCVSVIQLRVNIGLCDTSQAPISVKPLAARSGEYLLENKSAHGVGNEDYGNLHSV